MTSIPKRRKHRGGKRHSKLKRRRQAEREARLHQEHQPSTAGPGGSADSPPGTALFERPKEVYADIRLTRRAVNQGWQTDKLKAEAIFEKVQCQALGLPFTNSEGVTDRPAGPYTPDQLLGAAKLCLDIERQNQVDHHHQDRMDHAERALQARAKIGDFKPISIGVNGESHGNVHIYLPDNGRDKVDPDTLVPDPFSRDGMVGESSDDLTGSEESELTD